MTSGTAVGAAAVDGAAVDEAAVDEVAADQATAAGAPVTPVEAPGARPERRGTVGPAPRRARDLTGPVVLLMSCGLLLLSLVVVRGRHGDDQLTTDALYWTALLIIVVPAAARVLGRRTGWRERLLVSLGAGVLLQLSRTVLYPTRFTQHDELIHADGLRLLDTSHHLFTANPLLPVTSYYPGLQLVTDGVQRLTGLDAHTSAAVILVLARVVLTLAIIGVVDHLTGSPRAGCLANLIYVCNPQYVSFDAQFSYQSLALPLALLTVYAFVTRRPGGRTAGLVLPVACLLATIVTHHLTGLLLVAALGAWWAIQGLVVHGRDRAEVRALAIMTLIGVPASLAWGLRPGSPLAGYLTSIVDSSAGDLGQLLAGEQTNQLFRKTGIATPRWEEAASFASILILVLALVPALWQQRRHLRRRRAVATLLLGIAVLYPLVPAGHLTAATAEVADRAGGFIFLGVGFALVLLSVPSWRRASPWRLTLVLTTAVAVLFLGGSVIGAGPVEGRVPGPFVVGADARSADAANLAAARWLAGHEPAGTTVYADRIGGLLAAAVGGMTTVTHVATKIDASRLLLAPTFTDRDVQLIREAGISLVIADRRDAQALPQQRVYIESGEYGEENRGRPVPLEALTKLASVRGVQRVYDNGPIAIYDVSRLRAQG